MDNQTQPPDDLTSDGAIARDNTSEIHDTLDTPDTPNAPDHLDAAPDPRYAPTPDMEAENPEAGAVPPGYDWPTHGGYLGCLLGMMPACLIAGFLSSTFVAWPWFNGKSALPTVAVFALIVITFAACILGFGRLGWALGRRFYRKYPRGEPSWGEDDIAVSASASADVDDAQAASQSGQASQTTPGISGEASGQATP